MQPIATLLPDSLSVGTYYAFAPFCWREGDRALGRDIDFLRLFAAQMRLSCAVTFFDFDRLWERPGRAEVDIAAASIAPLPSRNTPGMVWSEPYTTVQRSILIRATDRDRFTTIADFAGCTVAATRGSTADLDTAERKPESTQLVYSASQDEAVHNLQSGAIDGYATGDLSSLYLCGRYPGKFVLADVHALVPGEVFAFAVRAASGLLEPLNAFIRENRTRY